MLKITGLRCSYGAAEVLHGIDLAVERGEHLCIAGPNGCGKTTLLKCAAGLLPYEGRIEVGGKDQRRYRRRELALRVGLMTQLGGVFFPYTVRETVALGRYAHLAGPLAQPGESDREIVESCLSRVGLENLGERRISELSGGQLQRVYLARLFAQDPDIVLLDEMTNHLDLKYQIELLEYVADWSRRAGKTVVSVLHDLNLVHAFAQRVALMQDGRVFACAPAREALSDDNLMACYGVDIVGWMRRSLANWTA